MDVISEMEQMQYCFLVWLWAATNYLPFQILLLDHPKKKIRDTQKYKPFKTIVKVWCGHQCLNSFRSECVNEL